MFHFRAIGYLLKSQLVIVWASAVDHREKSDPWGRCVRVFAPSYLGHLHWKVLEITVSHQGLIVTALITSLDLDFKLPDV